MAKISIIGEVTQITRKSGKPMASVNITVPANKSDKIPMGSVNITIETVQGDMFDK